MVQRLRVVEWIQRIQVRVPNSARLSETQRAAGRAATHTRDTVGEEIVPQQNRLVGGGKHCRRATFERCYVFVGGVHLGFGVLFLSCVCVCVGGVVLCRCVCVCDLLIFLTEPTHFEGIPCAPIPKLFDSRVSCNSTDETRSRNPLMYTSEANLPIALT